MGAVNGAEPALPPHVERAEFVHCAAARRRTRSRSVTSVERLRRFSPRLQFRSCGLQRLGAPGADTDAPAADSAIAMASRAAARARDHGDLPRQRRPRRHPPPERPPRIDSPDAKQTTRRSPREVLRSALAQGDPREALLPGCWRRIRWSCRPSERPGRSRSSPGDPVRSSIGPRRAVGGPGHGAMAEVAGFDADVVAVGTGRSR
jgi:hypothetical protein